MRLALITAGGAGMFCGSCMHDNTWVRALRRQGADATLIPTYTPIRVDEEDVSERRVFLGGVNVYLDYRWRWWSRLPRRLVRWLDSRWLLRLATVFGVSNDAAKLGELTVALLEGPRGPQRREIDELVAFLCDRLRPDAICFSNVLLGGVLPSLRDRFAGPIVCTLQGDDIFLESLPKPYRERALALIRSHVRLCDGFFVHSRYYRDFMSEYLSEPVERFRRITLGIDVTAHTGTPRKRTGTPFTVGYLARICLEKGVDRVIDAFCRWHQRRGDVRLEIAGYLGARDRRFFRRVLSAARRRIGDAVRYVGSPPDQLAKVRFLQGVDVLSVPTRYREPKGLYVLESLANGVPVVQPRHGAFPELVDATGGGLTFPPEELDELVAAWDRLADDEDFRLALAARGRTAVRERFNADVMAAETLQHFEELLRTRAGKGPVRHSAGRSE
ncbi:MAG: glycosyltransferase [Planctomycetota bacterium]|nr:MAG: glycosyltransferase [Planctomycetota bacterium]